MRWGGGDTEGVTALGDPGRKGRQGEHRREEGETCVCLGVEGREQQAVSLSFLSLKIPFSPEPALPQGHTLNVPLFYSGSRRFGS